MNGGIGPLPDWAARMHDPEQRRPRLAIDPGVMALRTVTAWALAPQADSRGT